MALPEWALVVLVAYPLAQIPLVVVLARRLKLEGARPAVVTPTMAYWTEEEPDPRLPQPANAEPGRCGRCGAPNDTAYTFCSGCLARI